MTQSIASTQPAKKMCQRTITLTEKIARKLERRAMKHGISLGEEITRSVISLWGITSDFDDLDDMLDPVQQEVLRTITRLHDRINPTAADLHNYLKNIDRAALQTALHQLIEMELLTTMRTSHSTRYILKK